MYIHELSPVAGSTHVDKRKGRGHATGNGKTAGRGHKGQKARSGGGGAFAYIKFIKPKQGAKVSADPDDYDFEDEEEYINEDVPEPEETEETK